MALLFHVYIVLIVALGIYLLFDEDAAEECIRLKDIESVAHVLVFMFTGPSLLIFNIIKPITKVIIKALTCKFRERK